MIGPARALSLSLLLSLILAAPAPAQQGPSSGALVIVGGAMRNPEILERFLALAGGVDAPLVVIPTAGGAATYDDRALASLRRAGATDVTLVHTYDPQEADTESFVAPIERARGVWFPGGRQWRLADAYLSTRTETALQGVLARGGVIGGSSAGATIQGEYLARGDSATNTIMMGDHEQGFAFLSGVAIDQHLLRRNRQFDLLEIVRARPDLLGIGIDEDTAIVVEGDGFEVIGSSYVAIYDAQRQIDSGGDFYFLAPGDRFELPTRTPLRSSLRFEPLERVVPRQQ